MSEEFVSTSKFDSHQTACGLHFKALESAMFGDGNGDLGMKVKVDKMYELLLGASLLARILKWLILGVVALGGIASLAKEAFKSLFHK